MPKFPTMLRASASSRRSVILILCLVFSLQAAHAQIFLNKADRIKAFTTALDARNVPDLKKIGTREIITGSDFIGRLCSLGTPSPQDIEIVDYLLGMGANVETPYAKLAPLAWAVKLKKSDLFIHLLTKGARSEAVDISGVPILHYLIKWDTSTTMIEALLPTYTAIDAVSEGDTPVRLCIKLNRLDVLAMLLKSGADPNLSVGSGPSPLAYASQYYEAVTRTENKPTRLECMRLLLEAGADVDIFLEGKPVLLKMIENGLSASAVLLLEHGVNPNKGDGKTTPLLLAIQKNQYSLVISLLDHKADPNLAASDVLPVFMALWTSFGELKIDRRIVMSLADNGADLTVKDKDGNTPYTIAWKVGDRTVSAYLAEHGAVDNDGTLIGDEAAYHFEKAKGSESALTRYLSLFPTSPYTAECERLISELKGRGIADFPFEIQTSLGGQLGEALKDKSVLLSAADSLGYSVGMQSFLKDSKIKVIVALNGNTLVFGLSAFNFNRNLLVKSSSPDRLDSLSVGDIIRLGNVLKVYATRIMQSAKAYGYKLDYFVAFERSGSTCLFTFQPSGLLNPITFIDGAGKQYVIEGEIGGAAIYYIPNPTDKVTGTLRTSSLLYTFFGSMTGPSSD